MNTYQKKINRQLRIEKFFKEDIWLHLIVLSSVALAAWIFNKWILAPMVYLSNIIVRLQFDKQYHCRHNKHNIAVTLCMALTCSVMFFTIANCLPLSVNLLSCIPISYLCAWVGYVVQDRIDLKVKAERTIFELPKDELLAYMENSTLRLEEKDAIQYYVIDKMKGERFYNAMGYCKKQSIRIYKSAVNKLNNLIRQ